MEDIARQIEAYLQKEQVTQLTAEEESRLSDLYRSLLNAMHERGVA